MRAARFLPLALLLGCASAERSVSEAPSTAPATPVAGRAFDVPALLGLNADQLAGPLTGKSIRPDHDRTPRTLPTGITEARYTYWRATTGLVVSYDPATLQVNSFFIRTQHGLTPDYTALLKLFSVSPYDKRLSIEPVASVISPRFFTGVRLVPRK